MRVKKILYNLHEWITYHERKWPQVTPKLAIRIYFSDRRSSENSLFQF